MTTLESIRQHIMNILAVFGMSSRMRDMLTEVHDALGPNMRVRRRSSTLSRAAYLFDRDDLASELDRVCCELTEIIQNSV